MLFVRPVYQIMEIDRHGKRRAPGSRGQTITASGKSVQNQVVEAKAVSCTLRSCVAVSVANVGWPEVSGGETGADKEAGDGVGVVGCDAVDWFEVGSTASDWTGCVRPGPATVVGST
jgi:hypothetical protein